MEIDPLNLVFLIGFAVYIGIRGLYEHRAKGSRSNVELSDTLGNVLLVPVGISSLLLPLVYIFTTWLSFFDYELPVFARWIGIVILVAALILFWRAHEDLGRNWSATLRIKEDHILITNGVYRYVRHPMYSAIFAWDIAQGMLLQNWLAGWSAFLTFLVLYLHRISKEEEMMSKRFGPEYAEYKKRSGRLIPRIRSFNS